MYVEKQKLSQNETEKADKLAAQDSGAEAGECRRQGHRTWLYKPPNGPALLWKLTGPQLKRIPPGPGSKAALRDPQVELDVSSKAIDDEAMSAICEALVKSITYKTANTSLEEIRFRDNDLTAGCLRNLAGVIKAARSDIQDIDLSSNKISIETSADAAAWEEFLRSFGRCHMLRRLDLSRNPLGPKAFECFAKIYIKESTFNSQISKFDNTVASSTDDLERLDLQNDEAERAKASLLPRRREGSIQSKASEANEPHRAFELIPVFTRTRGLRAIPYILLNDCQMDDECALHLSYILERHGLVAELIQNVPPARPGDHVRQLETYDAIEGCDGIIWKPNTGLTEHGSKALHLAECARSRGGDEAEEDCEEALVESSMNVSRKQTDAPSPFTPLSARIRRDSMSTNHSAPHSAVQRSLKTNPLRTARSRIQGDILRKSGPRANDLWTAALKMLRVARPLLLMPEEEAAQESDMSPDKSHEPRPATPSSEDRVSPFIRDSSTETESPTRKENLWPRLPTKPIETPTFAKPAVFKLSTNKRGKSMLQPEPTIQIGIPETKPIEEQLPDIISRKSILCLPDKQYHSGLPKGLDEKVWGRIIAHAVGADKLLEESQQKSVIIYARQRLTLYHEIESLGKPENTQIWRVLEGMGCLAYKEG